MSKTEKSKPASPQEPRSAARVPRQTELAPLQRIWRVPMLVVAVPVGIVSAFVTCLLVFFLLIGEVSSDTVRVRHQEWLGALYHSPFIEMVPYKEAMLHYHRPKIAAIGTSRAGPFRELFFSQPFVNLQSTIDSPAELDEFVTRNFTGTYRPEHLLIVTELWWFADKPVDGRKTDQRRNAEQKFLSVIEYFLHRKFGERRRHALGASLQADNSGSFLGIHGHVRHEGFSKRGSYYYEQIISGTRKSNDRKFSYSFNALAKGEHRFKHASGLNEARFDEFVDVLRRLDLLGISYSIILPPFAPAVAARMKPSEFPHHRMLVSRLQGENFAVFDFSKPGEIGSDNCEYIDGFHGGDVVYARLLANVADRQPAIAKYIHRSLLVDIATRGRGSAAWLRKTDAPEVDFLDLGCKRRAHG